MSVPRPALGVIFHPRFPSETLTAFARKAESAGFDELWLWDDCFLPGAFTSAAIALSATQRLKVGIGLLPAPVYNPLFAAMEITTLARAFPGRILPGFGHGLGSWMVQIGAAPQSSLATLGKTVGVVRQLLSGELVDTSGDGVNLAQVQMQMTPDVVPPLYVGAMREKTFQLAGRVGDGTILPAVSSPAYARQALAHIRAGMAQSGRSQHRLVVYLDAKVSPDGQTARSVMRRHLAEILPHAAVQLQAEGIAAEAARLVEGRTLEEAAARLPDAWLDALSAAGTPQQAADSILRLGAAGADSVVLQPLEGDPDCLDEYCRHLLPLWS